MAGVELLPRLVNGKEGKPLLFMGVDPLASRGFAKKGYGDNILIASERIDNIPGLPGVVAMITLVRLPSTEELAANGKVIAAVAAAQGLEVQALRKVDPKSRPAIPQTDVITAGASSRAVYERVLKEQGIWPAEKPAPAPAAGATGATGTAGQPPKSKM
jgi:hypothetical protein